MKKEILDPCCGSRKFYFDKSNNAVLFGDIRNDSYIQCDGRLLNVRPDQILDFRQLPFADESFSLVVFDPPHLKRVKPNSYMAQSYGLLDRETWQDDLRKGFKECWRVLKKNGTLIFKWSDHDIKLTTITKLFEPAIPIFGDKKTTSARGIGVRRFWLVYFKS